MRAPQASAAAPVALCTLHPRRQQRLTVKRAAGGGEAYGNLRDGNDALVEIEAICKWLMDPVACPTDWPRLIAIRGENPLYGQQQPVVA